MKKIAIIPTLFTLGNGVCGFAAIAYAAKIGTVENSDYYFALSGWLIVAAMVFDALDGYLARLSRTVSKFGAELDNLCDVISFGLAPAFLLLRLGPGWEPQAFLHQFLACVATLYLVCAILRLARYLVEATSDPTSTKRFRGLPSPGAAGCIATLAILRGSLDHRLTNIDPSILQPCIEIWATLGALVVALLMVSRVPYPHLTKQILHSFLHGRRHFSHVVQFILVVFVVVLTRELALLVFFWFYALALPLRYLIIRHWLHQPAPSPVSSGPDDKMTRCQMTSDE